MDELNDKVRLISTPIPNWKLEHAFQNDHGVCGGWRTMKGLYVVAAFDNKYRVI